MSQPRSSRVEWSHLDTALVAVFAALIAALSLAPAIPVGSVGVPITLQTLGVVLTGLILGPLRGFLATALYLVVGFAGLPVFAGYASTVAVLGKPSAGYLVSFPLAALLAGLVAHRLIKYAGRSSALRLGSFFVGGLVATVVIHVFGVVGLMIILDLNLSAALISDLAFVPGDLAKNLLASAIAVAVLTAFPRVVLQRRVTVTG